METIDANGLTQQKNKVSATACLASNNDSSSLNTFRAKRVNKKHL